MYEELSKKYNHAVLIYSQKDLWIDWSDWIFTLSQHPEQGQHEYQPSTKAPRQEEKTPG